jgi:DNA repair protein RecO (recombination protein O)
MTDERASGIILRTRPLTDTSLIVHWLTPELGRIATVAKGARKPKSSFYGKLDLFFEADLSFARSQRS